MLSYTIVHSLSSATEFTSSMEAAMVATSTNSAIRFMIEKQGYRLVSRQIGDGWYVEARRDICGEDSRAGLLQQFGTVDEVVDEPKPTTGRIPAEDLQPGMVVEIPTQPVTRFTVQRIEIVVGEGGNDEVDIHTCDAVGQIWHSKWYEKWNVVGHADIDVPDTDPEVDAEKNALRRASALVTLLRCIDQGDSSADCGLGVELLDTDRDFAARLLDWIGEDEASTIENWNP